MTTSMHTCAFCSKEGRKVCARCKKESYCSRECQLAAWKTHKKICSQLADEIKPAFVRPEATVLSSKVFPNSSSFWSTGVITPFVGFSEDEGISVWFSLIRSSARTESDVKLPQESGVNLLKVKILVQNFHSGPIKLFAKSVLLTMKESSFRKKVYQAGKEAPHFCEVNSECIPPVEQVVLDSGQFTVMIISFVVDEDSEQTVLKHCNFLEIPIKIEGKGVVKVKVEFDQNNINKFHKPPQIISNNDLSNVD